MVPVPAKRVKQDSVGLPVAELNHAGGQGFLQGGFTDQFPVAPLMQARPEVSMVKVAMSFRIAHFYLVAGTGFF
jgi:hypothetical protein